MRNALGEMWGDNAVQAPFMAIACRRSEGRMMIGGTLLADGCLSDKWERWRGTMIIVPTKIEVQRRDTYYRLEQMMVNDLVIDQVWKQQWSESKKS